MSHILYIHGFLSSPSSYKAKATQAWLKQHRPDLSFCCPELSSYPFEAENQLRELLVSRAPAFLIGSSLGGFWATFLVEEGLAERAVLINPAVSPQRRFQSLVGENLKSYYSDRHYSLSHADMAQLERCDRPQLREPERYMLLLQTGDEVLDYRLAEDRYQGSELNIEVGGDHSFVGYDRWLPRIMQFFCL